MAGSTIYVAGTGGAEEDAAFRAKETVVEVIEAVDDGKRRLRSGMSSAMKLTGAQGPLVIFAEHVAAVHEAS